jgi:hypothetical protein
MNIWGPILQIGGIIGTSIFMVFYCHNNRSYKAMMILLIIIFSASIIFGILAFLFENSGFYAFCLLAQFSITGALRIYIYEFITEIIFPVSPCIGLAIMHALSGLISLLISMLAGDIILKSPLNTSFPIIVFILCLAVTVGSTYCFVKYPYKLNRSDYDFGRRSTMINSYNSDSKIKKRVEKAHNDSIVQMLDDQEQRLIPDSKYNSSL